MFYALRSCWAQSAFIATPPLHERNLPDQTGKVYCITGGYAGVGEQLARILYQHNATVIVAGRSEEKYSKSESRIKAGLQSEGSVEFLKLDLADLTTIKQSAEQLKSKHSKLHVLVNNAGVMIPPAGSKTAQGQDLQLGTNCLGHWLFTSCLASLLESTASQSAANTVRVAWAGSLAVDLGSPKNGITFEENGDAKVLDVQTNYAQSKTGNYFMAAEFGRLHPSIVSVSFNPGNLMTELQRHVPSFVVSIMNATILYKAIFGAYTELFCAASPTLDTAKSGSFVAPWGQIRPVRPDIELGVKTKEEGGTGAARQFVAWCDKVVGQYK